MVQISLKLNFVIFVNHSAIVGFMESESCLCTNPKNLQDCFGINTFQIMATYFRIVV